VPPICCSGRPVRSNANSKLGKFGLKKIEVDPSYVYLHPDGASIAVWHDPRRTADEIRRFSKPDAEAYLEYSRFLDALFDLAYPYMLANPGRPDPRTVVTMARAALRHRKLLRPFGQFLLASGEETIEQRFTHPITQSLLYCLGAGANPINLNERRSPTCFWPSCTAEGRRGPSAGCRPFRPRWRIGSGQPVGRS